MSELTFPVFDLHVHATPDTYARRYTPFTLGEEMKQIGGGAVIKSHLSSTTAVAKIARDHGLPVYGSITLNRYAGGLSPHVVQAAIAANGDDAPMLIWFPTLTGHGCKPRIAQTKSHPVLEAYPAGEERVSQDGVLRQEAIDVIRLATERGLALATGHASKQEVYLLAEEVIKQGGRLMLTHPIHPCTGLTPEETADLLGSGHIWAESAVLMSKIGYEKVEDLLTLLQLAGTDRICISTDFGQVKNPPVTEGYAWFLDELRQAAEQRGIHLPSEALQQLCYDNPRRFLGF